MIMRKRKSSDSSSNSDEESVQVAEPPEGIEEDALSAKSHNCMRTLFLNQLGQGKAKWVQCIIIFVAAFLTYSYNNVGSKVNVQISIMTVITIFGASPYCKSHLVPAAIGAFVGGQNIIAATTDNENTIYASNYLWLLLLSVVVGLVWCFVITPFKVLDGSAGRLGTTTFIGMNITMLLFFGPLGVVPWERYIFGLYQVVFIAEEDTRLDITNAWDWTDEAELAVGYFISVVWLGVSGGAIRIAHNNTHPPEALNNVLIPSLIALVSMLVINSAGYKHAYGLYNGFAVGAYVAMASLKQIPTVRKFTLVSCAAAIWGLVLTPFFVGFPGKSGFTSMMGHQTFEIIERILKKCHQRRLAHRRQEDQMRRTNDSQQHHPEQEALQPAAPIHHDESPSIQIHHPHSHKPQRENSVLLKHQRRQQSRLRHYQDQNQGNGPGFESNSKLQHRGWSATQTDAADGWQHTLESQQDNNNDVV